MTKNLITKQYDPGSEMAEFAERGNSHVLNILTFLFWICFGFRYSNLYLFGKSINYENARTYGISI
jgi:hypothetical protein